MMRHKAVLGRYPARGVPHLARGVAVVLRLRNPMPPTRTVAAFTAQAPLGRLVGSGEVRLQEPHSKLL
eukprot:4944209-Prymnesium_polylepis.2